jgi:hypothetical protein
MVAGFVDVCSLIRVLIGPPLSDRSRALHVAYTRLVPMSDAGTLRLVCPLSIDTRIPCGVHPSNHLPHLPHLSFLRHPMGCFSSKPVQVDPPSATATAEREATQRQSSPVTQPVAKRSSQHSRANAGHQSPPVEEVFLPERPRSKSPSHQRPPIAFSEESPPRVPSHRIRAKSTHASSIRNTSIPVIPGEYYRRWSA